MKVGAILKEMSVIFAGMIMAVGLFSLISFILLLFNVKVFDTWLLAGLSLIFSVNYIIFRSPTLATS
jgi:sensor histidine kinase YesM